MRPEVVFLRETVNQGLSSEMAVVKGVTSRHAGGGGENMAPSGKGVMDSGFQYFHAKHRKVAIRMFSGFGLLTKYIQLSSEGRENTFSLC